MERVDDIRLEPLPGEMPRAMARRGGASWEVAGEILEGAWAVGEAVLLATTDDIPQEDSLHLSLLEPDGAVEAVTLGAAYTTGSFEALDSPGARLDFAFFGDTRWSLTVLERPAWRLPFSDPRGVSRQGGWSSRLRIEGAPRPGP